MDDRQTSWSSCFIPVERATGTQAGMAPKGPTGNQTTFPWVNHVILIPNRAFAKEHAELMWHTEFLYEKNIKRKV
jgi:hypothetical protein